MATTDVEGVLHFSERQRRISRLEFLDVGKALTLINKIWIEMKKVVVILTIFLVLILVASLCCIGTALIDYERGRELRISLQTHSIISLTEGRPATQQAFFATKTAEAIQERTEAPS